MTREEAKKVFLMRGYVEVDGGTIYDADKWRESCTVISEWLIEQEERTEMTNDGTGIVLRNLFEDICDFLDKQPTVNAIPIPENATNGDMIKAMFPNDKIHELQDIIIVFGCDYQYQHHYPIDWWKAPYKAESEDKE